MDQATPLKTSLFSVSSENQHDHDDDHDGHDDPGDEDDMHLTHVCGKVKLSFEEKYAPLKILTTWSKAPLKISFDNFNLIGTEQSR